MQSGEAALEKVPAQGKGLPEGARSYDPEAGSEFDFLVWAHSDQAGGIEMASCPG
jgi:hypothetical protein